MASPQSVAMTQYARCRRLDGSNSLMFVGMLRSWQLMVLTTVNRLDGVVGLGNMLDPDQDGLAHTMRGSPHPLRPDSALS